MIALDLTTKRFGLLTAIEIASRKPVKWRCICDCGNEKLMPASVLNTRAHSQTSCGCMVLSDIPVIVGGTFNTKSCGELQVIELLPKYEAICQFKDGTKVKAQTGNIRIGNVSNPNQPTSYGVGYFGQGPFHALNTQSHAYWHRMLQRAYCPVYHAEHPTYEGVSVCDEWHNYQNFAAWVKERKQYGRHAFNLDKDLKIPGNKVYSPEACSLVPQHINKLTVAKSKHRDLPRGVTMSGLNYMARCMSAKGTETYLGTFATANEASDAYRTFKKKTIIETANMYKEDLDEEVYQALLNFEVT